MKITDKILAKGTEPHIAFEYFPPRTEEGVKNLTRRFKLMASQEPLCVPRLRRCCVHDGGRVRARAHALVPHQSTRDHVCPNAFSAD